MSSYYIDYSGSYGKHLPHNHDLKYHLKPSTHLYKWHKDEWVRTETPDRYHFHDIKGEQYFLVEKGKITVLSPHLFYCDHPHDVNAITRMQVIQNENFIVIPIIGKDPVISRYSQIQSYHVVINGNTATIDVSDIPNGEARTFSYISGGSILLVNYIIIRLQSISP